MQRKIQILLAALVLCSLCVAVVATSDEGPVLKITQISTNVFEVGITNGTNTGYYELYHTPVLADGAYPWILTVVGTQGQTNFLITNNISQAGFYFVGFGNDWDEDGIHNYMDGNPLNTNIGAIQILIDSPTNGAVFQ